MKFSANQRAAGDTFNQWGTSNFIDWLAEWQDNYQRCIRIKLQNRLELYQWTTYLVVILTPVYIGCSWSPESISAKWRSHFSVFLNSDFSSPTTLTFICYDENISGRMILEVLVLISNIQDSSFIQKNIGLCFHNSHFNFLLEFSLQQCRLSILRLHANLKASAL